MLHRQAFKHSIVAPSRSCPSQAIRFIAEREPSIAPSIAEPSCRARAPTPIRPSPSLPTPSRLALHLSSLRALHRCAIHSFPSHYQSIHWQAICKLSSIYNYPIPQPSVALSVTHLPVLTPRHCQSSSNVESTNKSSIIHHILKSTIGLRGL